VVEGWWDSFIRLIGGRQEYEDITVMQVAVRTLVIYGVALLMIRLGKRRFMGNYSAFDILLGFIVGSIMARAVTGAISLLNMVVVIGVLMGIHWLLVTISFYWEGFDKVVENQERELVIDGEIQHDAMEASKITENDLLQALREKGGVEDPQEVKLASLERDGTITVIPKDDK
jgi:uncharacterized membrane protein YcaP (DUF421 family)